MVRVVSLIAGLLLGVGIANAQTPIVHEGDIINGHSYFSNGGVPTLARISKLSASLADPAVRVTGCWFDYCPLTGSVPDARSLVRIFDLAAGPDRTLLISGNGIQSLNLDTLELNQLAILSPGKIALHPN